MASGPKNLQLFGKYLQRFGAAVRYGFEKYQLTKLIPPKAFGRMPSAGSQMGLYGDDDYKSYTRVSLWGDFHSRKVKPQIVKKDFRSDALNQTIYNLNVTPAALYAMDDAGGFDNYILNTPPEDLRSCTGEKMRQLAYYYMENPEAKSWALPWKVLMRKRDQLDPVFARYKHEAKKEAYDRSMRRRHRVFSPYFLPESESEMHPERQTFLDGSDPPKLNMWWKAETPQEQAERRHYGDGADAAADGLRRGVLEAAFRRRLGDAKSYERAYASHRLPDGYKLGFGMGGGGPSGRQPRMRSKTYKWRQLRPY
jgi:large subunit ribosomal protein L28